ncbi:hypothetical protein F5Y06DRAFT_207950 [Hypoxylon sp. FL0890]|nr:hypothetical protein F5Y06DRAFT_207950 [Hypoxylon sp. FL0890]
MKGVATRRSLRKTRLTSALPIDIRTTIRKNRPQDSYRDWRAFIHNLLATNRSGPELLYHPRLPLLLWRLYGPDSMGVMGGAVADIWSDPILRGLGVDIFILAGFFGSMLDPIVGTFTTQSYLGVCKTENPFTPFSPFSQLVLGLKRPLFSRVRICTGSSYGLFSEKHMLILTAVVEVVCACIRRYKFANWSLRWPRCLLGMVIDQFLALAFTIYYSLTVSKREYQSAQGVCLP